MSIDINPVEVEKAIRTCADRISKSVSVCDQRYRVYLEAQRSYDRAWARAYLGAVGPAHEKKPRAELATVRERDLLDEADAAYRFAERTSRAVQDELRAWQSVGASVRAMFSVAGRGEF